MLAVDRGVPGSQGKPHSLELPEHCTFLQMLLVCVGLPYGGH